MKTKLNNSVRKLKHSKKTSKLFNTETKSAKKIVRKTHKINLKKTKKQKKIKKSKKMVGGAPVNITIKCETKGSGPDEYKDCRIEKSKPCPPSGDKTIDVIRKEQDKVIADANLLSLKDETDFNIAQYTLIIKTFIDCIMCNFNKTGDSNVLIDLLFINYEKDSTRNGINEFNFTLLFLRIIKFFIEQFSLDLAQCLFFLKEKDENTIDSVVLIQKDTEGTTFYLLKIFQDLVNNRALTEYTEPTEDQYILNILLYKIFNLAIDYLNSLHTTKKNALKTALQDDIYAIADAAPAADAD